MTSDDLRDWLADADLSQKALARALGINYRTVRRWCSGQNPIPDTLPDGLARLRRDDIMERM